MNTNLFGQPTEAPAPDAFDREAPPFTVEWGTRAYGNRTETFDELDEALAFAKKRGAGNADHVTIYDGNGHDTDPGALEAERATPR